MTARSGYRTAGPPTTPTQALAELCAGNQRFVDGTRIHPNQDAEHRAALADAQTPFAVVFGCSDSRLAAEIIFDRGLGDLFVVRTAGHTVGPQVLGSIEYAVTILDTPLVVVLGHTSCGAVNAALDSAAADLTPPPPGHLGAVVDAILPTVHHAAAHGVHDPDAIVNLHITRTVENLLRDSPVLAAAAHTGRCAVVGMSYQLAAGRIHLVEPKPTPSAVLPHTIAAAPPPSDDGRRDTTPNLTRP